MYALVLIQYGVKILDKTFTYKIPDNLIVKIGNKVKVSFSNKIIYGIVIDIKNNSDFDRVSEIIEVVNPELYLNEELLKLGYFIRDNTLCTLIKAYQTMLPSSLKVKNINSNYNKYDEFIKLNKDKKIILDYIRYNKNSKSQIDILNKLLKNEVLNKKEISLSYKKLLDKDLIKIEKVRKYRINQEKKEKLKYNLTLDQSSVVNKILLNQNNTYLLYGITGSGKTICYIDLINKVIENNKTAIMLVPEISLTTQMVDRLYNSFGNDVAILHSGLSDGEKYDEYCKISNDLVKVVVGTRSAIFAPLKNIGIIIIDEEHSSTYKQENNPRYNTIDISKWRCV